MDRQSVTAALAVAVAALVAALALLSQRREHAEKEQLLKEIAVRERDALSPAGTSDHSRGPSSSQNTNALLVDAKDKLRRAQSSIQSKEKDGEPRKPVRWRIAHPDTCAHDSRAAFPPRRFACTWTAAST
jgi:hypothetical protein